MILSPLAQDLPGTLSAAFPLGWLLLIPALILLIVPSPLLSISQTSWTALMVLWPAACSDHRRLATALDAPWSLWGLVGSLLGFLFWNWSPAKVFMGDVGSTFLGRCSLACYYGHPAGLRRLLTSSGTPLMGDVSLLPRRLLAGQRVSSPPSPSFQRLHQAGWPHSRVSLIYILATVLRWHACGRLALGVRSGSCRAAGWGVARSACGGALCGGL